LEACIVVVFVALFARRSGLARALKERRSTMMGRQFQKEFIHFSSHCFYRIDSTPLVLPLYSQIRMRNILERFV
jgi:hypothetical protein